MTVKTLTFAELHEARSICDAAANELMMAAHEIDAERAGRSTAAASVALATLQLTIVLVNSARPALEDVINVRRRLRRDPDATVELSSNWLEDVQGLCAADRFEPAYIREIGEAAWDAIPITPELADAIRAAGHVMAMRREAGE